MPLRCYQMERHEDQTRLQALRSPHRTGGDESESCHQIPSRGIGAACARAGDARPIVQEIGVAEGCSPVRVQMEAVSPAKSSYRRAAWPTMDLASSI